jgi:hypothetical protein
MRSPRKMLAVVLAAGLLAAAGVSGTVVAHGPGGGPPGGWPPVGWPPIGPGTSAKPLPSGWAWPSDDLHSFGIKPGRPLPSKDPDKTKSPNPSPPAFVCPPASASASASAPSVVGDFSKLGLQLKGGLPGGNWPGFVAAWRAHFQVGITKQFCSIPPLRAELDRLIAGKIKSLQDMVGQVGSAPGLSAAGKTTIDGELNSLIADLQALKTKVDAETTLAALQADLATLTGKAHLYRTVAVWVRLIIEAENVISAGPGLVSLENTIAGQIAAAPPGPETTDAQTFLDNMKLSATQAETLAGPIPAMLLAITPAQLASGAADTTITKANVDLFQAMWDLKLAHWSAFWAQLELKEAAATSKSPATPTPTPTPV